MPATVHPSRALMPGTTGWSASDLDDPEIERQWERGRYEIIEGILVQMPPPFFDHGSPLPDVLVAVRNHLRSRGGRPAIAVEVDLIDAGGDVYRVDGVLLTAEDVARQKAVRSEADRGQDRLGRLRVRPTLVIESVSEGHEQHDRVLKRRRYAAMGIRNFWILDYATKSLECLRLAGEKYTTDARGEAGQAIEPSAFPGMTIQVEELFG